MTGELTIPELSLVVLIAAIRTYGGLSQALALPLLRRGAGGHAADDRSHDSGHGTPVGIPPPPVIIH